MESIPWTRLPYVRLLLLRLENTHWPPELHRFSFYPNPAYMTISPRIINIRVKVLDLRSVSIIGSVINPYSVGHWTRYNGTGRRNRPWPPNIVSNPGLEIQYYYYKSDNPDGSDVSIRVYMLFSL